MDQGNDRGTGGALPPPGGDTDAAVWLRPEGRFYNFTRQHFELLEDLSRLYPDLSDRLDLRRLDPGTESIESVSRLLLDCLAEDAGEHLFLAFCKLNADRLLDHIHLRLQRGAWPLAADDVLAQIYAALYRETRQQRLGVALGVHTDLLRQARAGSVFRTLACHADRVVDEQVQDLRARSLPLPDVPAPVVDAGKTLLENGRSIIRDQSVELTEEELGQWVCHALMTLDDADRHVLYLRDRLQLGVEEIANQLDRSPLDIMRILQQARVRFQECLTSLVSKFCDDDPPDHQTLRFEVPGEEGDDAG